ncbi:hypothetical protein TcasGA2_TC031296 [Tribolium castaneum]|uniref:Uncharacterized protein n=1 Tax=Tribolium castaneum TaxID=7070 RepID=A0A139W9X4_TRICA|nr:hypothetical protein TcasGA2_TC031296 [Tribolium castaneum]
MVSKNAQVTTNNGATTNPAPATTVGTTTTETTATITGAKTTPTTTTTTQVRERRVKHHETPRIRETGAEYRTGPKVLRPAARPTKRQQEPTIKDGRET